MRNRYLNTIAYVDSLLNSFLGFLQQQNQLANSIIIITGDHGEGFLEHNRVAHSRHLDQEAVRVPLIIWGANEYVPRWRPTVPVGHVDIAPTIYYLLGLPEHPSFQGEIVVKPRTASDLESTPDRPLFLSIQALMHEDAMILWPWKIVRNLWGEGLRVYRLDTDPGESNNLRNIDTASARKLCTCLVGFRAAQLDYYDPLKKLESRYHPPKYHTCDDISVKGAVPVEFCELR